MRDILPAAVDLVEKHVLHKINGSFDVHLHGNLITPAIK